MQEITYHIRRIQQRDNPAVAHIIRTVMTEHGLVGPGYSIHDPEVDSMWESYDEEQHVFFVVEAEGEILGCGGVAPLAGEEASICELRKMYFLPALRGRGAGQALLETCLAAAREAGFTQCYLETTPDLTRAMALYEKAGFRRIHQQLGCTGHSACEVFYMMPLV